MDGLVVIIVKELEIICMGSEIIADAWTILFGFVNMKSDLLL